MAKRGVMGFLNQWLLKSQVYDNAYDELAVLKVKDLMTRDVLFIHDHNKLTEAAHTMIGAHVSCLVVMDETKLKGIITERDFIKKFDMGPNAKVDLMVDDLMTREVFSVDPATDLFAAQKIMREHSFRKLVVIQNNELKGIITQTDLCRIVARLNTPILGSPLIKDVMSKNVLTVSSDEKFQKAKKLMAANGFGCVLVKDGNDIKGIFTEYDLVSEYFMNPNKLKNSYMKDLVNSPTVCITPDFDLVFVNKLMIIKNFRRLPVVQDNKLLGIITQTDIAKHLYEFIQKNTGKKLTDEEKKKPIHTEYDVIKKGNVILYQKIRPVATAQKKVLN